MKSNKKTNREKNRKLTMISFLPAIIWLILLLVFVKPEWTTDSSNQSADGRMDPTSLFSTGQCGRCAHVSEKMGTLYRLFHRIRIIGFGNEECDESLESGVCGIRTLYDPGNCG